MNHNLRFWMPPLCTVRPTTHQFLIILSYMGRKKWRVSVIVTGCSNIFFLLLLLHRLVINTVQWRRIQSLPQSFRLTARVVAPVPINSIIVSWTKALFQLRSLSSDQVKQVGVSQLKKKKLNGGERTCMWRRNSIENRNRKKEKEKVFGDRAEISSAWSPSCFI